LRKVRYSIAILCCVKLLVFDCTTGGIWTVGRLEGRVALVTGAAQGIGRGIARLLAQEGVRLVVSDVNTAAGQEVANETHGRFIVQDVAAEAEWQRVIANVAASEGSLHILVNNAGIEGSQSVPKDPEHAPLEDWNQIFRVNCTGVFLACKHAIALMARSGGGSIINLSSVGSLVPTPFLTAYGAAKAAVDHLSRSVALHCAQAGYKIRCNSVHPGQVQTPMLDALFDRMSQQAGVSRADFTRAFVTKIPLGEIQEPLDIAQAVLFLASSESRYITGQSLAVDGGFTLIN
jgi:3(or 17)beta-hydroxysteroid dehydrogenase